MTKFVIVIPTRERADTLYWTLKTILSQNYINLEIIVSDNFSADNTKEVVASFHDLRIIYLNTGKRISMSHNWEFALNHVKEGFISFFGDDDGLLPNALSNLDKIIKETGCDAVSSKIDFYSWPNYIRDFERNIMSVSIGKGYQILDAKQLFEEVRNYKKDYTILPWIYRSFVDYKLIKEVKLKSGEFFKSAIPDLYSAVVLSQYSKKYCYLNEAFALNGASSHSNGSAFMNPDIKQGAKEKFLSENNIQYHPKLSLSPSIAVMTQECILQAEEYGILEPRSLDIEKLLLKSIRDIQYKSKEMYDSVINSFREIILKNDVTPKFLNNLINEYPNKNQKNKLVEGYNYFYKQLIIDTTKFGVSNIYDATILHEKIILNRRKYIFKINTLLINAKFLILEIKRRGFCNSILTIIKKII